MAESNIIFPIEGIHGSGYYSDAANPSKTLTTATWTKIVTFTLPKGLWIIDACIRFGSNANGRRFIAIDPNVTGSNTYHTAQCKACQNDQTYVRRTAIINNAADNDDYGIWGYQSSGGDLSVNYYMYRRIKLA